MGKKVIVQEKQNFNNLIKVLKPKVYITNSSCFKKLVQELTGNADSNSLSPQTLEVSKVVENCNIIETETTSFDNSVSTEGTSYNSSQTSGFSCDDRVLNEEFNQVCNQLCLDNESLFFQDFMVNQPLDELMAFQNVESLLFDVELPNPFYNYCQEIEGTDVSIYDYELL
ncbi:unnamed protein product [Lathyrus sativus]|nr:unnamed protein product [Lathyrus sativus]